MCIKASPWPPLGFLQHLHILMLIQVLDAALQVGADEITEPFRLENPWRSIPTIPSTARATPDPGPFKSTWIWNPSRNGSSTTALGWKTFSRHRLFPVPLPGTAGGLSLSCHPLSPGSRAQSQMAPAFLGSHRGWGWAVLPGHFLRLKWKIHQWLGERRRKSGDSALVHHKFNWKIEIIG